MSEGAGETLNVAIPVEVTVGEEIPADKLHSFVVEQDIGMPDMCAISLRNQGHHFSDKIKLGDPIEVKVTKDSTTVFKGEVVTIEAMFKTGGESRLTVRGFNKLHRLLRGPKSRTFVGKSDSQIASQLASDNNLSPDVEDTGVVHDHVYQHNQTDLEFLRMRAARCGFELIVDDRTLHFRKPQTGSDSGVELQLQDPQAEGLIKVFSPKISSAQIAKEVEVRAWDPEKKELIVGKANAEASSLGANDGAKGSSAFGKTAMVSVDHPVASTDEANKLAKAKLDELMMGYITGDALCKGNAKLKAGITVKVTVNTDKPDDRFNGKYFLNGCTHRYRHSSEGGEGGGGYTTAIRFSRDAEKGK